MISICGEKISIGLCCKMFQFDFQFEKFPLKVQIFFSNYILILRILC